MCYPQPTGGLHQQALNSNRNNLSLFIALMELPFSQESIIIIAELFVNYKNNIGRISFVITRRLVVTRNYKNL